MSTTRLSDVATKADALVGTERLRCVQASRTRWLDPELLEAFIAASPRKPPMCVLELGSSTNGSAAPNPLWGSTLYDPSGLVLEKNIIVPVDFQTYLTSFEPGLYLSIVAMSSERTTNQTGTVTVTFEDANLDPWPSAYPLTFPNTSTISGVFGRWERYNVQARIGSLTAGNGQLLRAVYAGQHTNIGASAVVAMIRLGD